jgi:hypothetical protein
MNRALVLTALSFSFLLAAPMLQGCSSASPESTDGTSSDDLKKSCKGPLPDICERCSDGSSECAHWVKTDGKCEIQICPPAPVCDGPLPDLCRLCSDGTSACAHWEVVDGKCTIETCPVVTTIDPNACTKDSDCTGPLPMLCKVCADGSDGCAHHVCSAGECTTAYCD